MCILCQQHFLNPQTLDKSFLVFPSRDLEQNFIEGIWSWIWTLAGDQRRFTFSLDDIKLSGVIMKTFRLAVGYRGKEGRENLEKSWCNFLALLVCTQCPMAEFELCCLLFKLMPCMSFVILPTRAWVTKQWCQLHWPWESLRPPSSLGEIGCLAQERRETSQLSLSPTLSCATHLGGSYMEKVRERKGSGEYGLSDTWFPTGN